VIAVYLAPRWEIQIGLKGLLAGFPTDLFLTLVGVTLLFTQAEVNGTLEQVSKRAVASSRGNVGFMPVAFFGLALGIASIGAGNIAAAALVAPMALAVAGRVGIPSFLMTIMVGHGAVAGALSPFAPTGIIAADRMSRIGLDGFHVQTYLYNLLANAAVAVAGYLAFGGWRLFGRYDTQNGGLEFRAPEAGDPGTNLAGQPKPAGTKDGGAIEIQHGITLAVIAALVVGVIFLKVHVGLGAFAGASLLTLLRVADEKEVVRSMPWGVILMVCGVTVLTAMLEQTGGLDRFAAIVGRVSNVTSVTGVIAFVTGLVSVYSSTSGVVLPAFLPSVPDVIEHLGGGDPLAIALSIIVGGHLVDVSPLSTIGALCIASASPSEDRRKLFNKVLAWGLSMSAVGAVVCYVFFGLL
jgi:di/tricarboxylate transporter